MVIFVKYHIDKDYFIKHKKKIQKILQKPAFDIAVMKFERGMSCLEIAKRQHISAHFVRRVLSGICGRIRKNGFRI